MDAVVIVTKEKEEEEKKFPGEGTYVLDMMFISWKIYPPLFIFSCIS